MAEVKQISPAQRAQNFAAATRQNFHMLPAQTTTQFGSTLQFTYPKSRLLSKTWVMVEGSFKATNAEFLSLVNSPDKYAVYSIIRRISLSLNNGFDPFTVSGRDLAIMNTIRMNPDVITAKTLVEPDGNAINSESVIDMSYDTDNGVINVKFLLELENTLNQRDTAGLILLQNESTQVTLSIDIDTKYINATTVTVENIKVTPMLQTYTIPNYAEAFPDLSILKLVKSRTETLSNAGEHILKLDVGTIYRKLVLYVTDINGNPYNAENIGSNIELIYNTADTPISIDPTMLRLKNTSDFGTPLPKGVYVLDFSGYPSMSNMGGSRDYVDTERLSEFWIRLSTKKQCKISIIQENISRLR